MDSMRSLNSSLPTSRSRQATPPDLLQAFRTAALSVTNLYKSAAADQSSTRQAGYQDALEDLLKLLDEENLGVQDGEGWRIRQWATQRYGGGGYQSHSEADDDSDVEQRQRLGSTSGDGVRSANENTSNTAPEPESESKDAAPSPEPIFRFSGNQPPESYMQTDSSGSQSADEHATSSPSFPMDHANRNRPGPRSSSSRSTNRMNPRDFTFSAGTKRKLNFPDFFDLSNLPERREGSGGSKRGRHV